LAQEIWTEHYTPIIGEKQIDYMLQRFQSEQAITAQLSEGYEYFLLSSEGKAAGYMAIFSDSKAGKTLLSKLYLRKTARGRGFGRELLRFAQAVCKERGIRTLWLTVNKNNHHSIAWYQEAGFTNTGSIVQNIGGGFVMDDYRMAKPLQ